MSSARLECAASRLCISGTGLSRRSEERYRQCRRQALEGSGGPWWGGGRCRTGAAIIFSAGDLVGHLNCRYLTSLDLKVARGELAKPSLRSDPTLDALAERGEIHEQGFVEHLAKKGATVTIIPGIGIEDESVARTRDAMARGDAVIVQAALRDGVWSGRADVLRRVETPSGFGAWSYEVTDTKLARETKGNTVLQLSLYSDLLARVQQAVPETAYVVTPGTEYLPEAYRVADFAAFYRRIKQNLEAFAAAPPTDGPVSRADRALRDLLL
jgi:predicted RecB family nuclease